MTDRTERFTAAELAAFEGMAQARCMAALLLGKLEAADAWAWLAVRARARRAALEPEPDAILP